MRFITGSGGNRMIFVDEGQFGSGVPRYTNAPAYRGSPTPRVVGSRFICGPCGVHDVSREDKGPQATSDSPPEVAMNTFEGGSKAAYAKAVDEHNKTHKHKVA